MVTRAKDIMTTELIVGYPDMTIEEAIKALVNNRITGIPVVDENKKIIGVCSEYDIIKAVNEGEDSKPINLREKIPFSSSVKSVNEDTPLKDILTLFVDNKVRRLPVLGQAGELVGIISRRDIMRVLFYRSKTL